MNSCASAPSEGSCADSQGYHPVKLLAGAAAASPPTQVQASAESGHELLHAGTGASTELQLPTGTRQASPVQALQAHNLRRASLQGPSDLPCGALCAMQALGQAQLTG